MGRQVLPISSMIACSSSIHRSRLSSSMGCLTTQAMVLTSSMGPIPPMSLVITLDKLPHLPSFSGGKEPQVRGRNLLSLTCALLHASREELQNRPRLLGSVLDYKHAPQ